jgi:hypothetical protein
MKTEQFKKIIKSSVREAIQEELKEILLEAMKSEKSTISENKITQPPTPQPSQEISNIDLRQKYMDILGETAMSFSTKDISPFNPTGQVDLINGNLGSGEVGMDQIMSLLKK